MQITDESKEQVLMGVQRLRSMTQTARASHSLATELSISLSPASDWKNGPPLIRPLELLPLHPVAQRQPSRPASAVTNFTIDVNQIPSSSDDFGDEDDNSSGEAEVAIASSVGGGGGGPASLTANSGPISSRGFFSQLVAASGCKRSLSGENINRHQNVNNINNNVVSGGANSDQETRGAEVSSRASDEEESGSTRKKLRLSKEQSALLEESFKEHSTLNPKQKNALAKQLNLRPRQVEVWFQNRRARTKLKQTEVDCELLKRCCESLTEENRRLHKELQELRALKVAAPCVIAHDFYMPLPAATLTMCPSCERVATTMDHNRSPLNFSAPSAQGATVNAAGASTTSTSAAVSASISPQIAGISTAFPQPQRQQSSAAC